MQKVRIPTTTTTTTILAQKHDGDDVDDDDDDEEEEEEQEEEAEAEAEDDDADDDDDDDDGHNHNHDHDHDGAEDGDYENDRGVVIFLFIRLCCWINPDIANMKYVDGGRDEHSGCVARYFLHVQVACSCCSTVVRCHRALVTVVSAVSPMATKSLSTPTL